MQLHIAFDLVEKLVTRFDVKIQPRIRPAEDHDEKVFVANDKTVSPEWRVEVVLFASTHCFK